MHRSALFEHRRMLYTALDEQFCSRTRFFAAAALTNSVFAQLFQLLPQRWWGDVYRLLSDAGALLEVANRRWARDLARSTASGAALDDCLVRSEQKLLQSYLDARRDRADGCWEPIRTELNRLLNDHHVTAMVSRCFTRSRQYSGVLGKLRVELAGTLDFADESHRIQIGLGIIRHIRVTT